MTSQYNSKKNLVYGIGYNDVDYQVHQRIGGSRLTCPYYTVWNGMLTRCYSPKWQKKRPTYIDCEASDEWLSFSNFRKWMKDQDWKGKQLDKDIIFPGNKVYSPETCVFVSSQINSLLSDCGASRGSLPQGVTMKGARYDARISISGKRKHIGMFASKEEASSAYMEAKRKHILTVACCEPDIRVKQGLYRHSLLYS